METDSVYRALAGPDDAAGFARIMVRAFAVPEAYAARAPQQFGEHMRGLVQDGEVRACLAVYPMGQWIGGRRLACAGVAAVGVLPEHRGAGLATRLLEHSLREQAESGAALAALYPSTLGLYRGVGFEIAGARYRLDIPCQFLARHPSDGTVEPLEDVRDSRMRACYARVAPGRNGWLDRGEALWERVRVSRGEQREGYGVARGGELAGYVWLSRRKRRDGRFDVLCSEFVAEDAAAARALLAFLGAHSTLAARVELFAGLADPFVGLLPETNWKVALQDPWMLRVLDLPAAIRGRGWPRGRSAELHLDVDDPLLERNHGRFVVRVEDGTANVERGGTGRIACAARALGSWLSGHATAEALAFQGLIRAEAGDLAELSAAAALPPPTMPDFF